MIPLADEEEVHVFMKAVYPGFSDLALSVFSEKIVLREATELITRLRSDLDTVTGERDALLIRLESKHDQCGYGS
jgi:hypothetical protein